MDKIRAGGDVHLRLHKDSREIEKVRFGALACAGEAAETSDRICSLGKCT